MTTKPMNFICAFCKEAVPMTEDFKIWNFEDSSFAHPVGYCSYECIESAADTKYLTLKKADEWQGWTLG